MSKLLKNEDKKIKIQYEKRLKFKAKCDVCGHDIFVDEVGNGDDCQNCGWRQSIETFEHPNVAGIRNITSLNNAKKQYKQGKSAILANLDDFVNAYENYGEVEFTYNNTRYGVECCENENVVMYNIKTNQKQYFANIYDFKENAKIDGKNLKDIWHKVTNTDFLQ